MRRLEHELSRYRRYGDTFALLLFDIDDFKAVNDTHGHQAGDHVLQRFSELLTEMTRDTSIPARYGGEEFALLEPRASVADGLTLAERVRSSVEITDFGGVRVTVSGGVAGCPAHGEDARTLVGAADRALYRSKRRGKNAVTAAEL
jgi:diguanylate cyclase (GGDEF)-like protein